jgi:CRISPR-associated protein Cmr4
MHVGDGEATYSIIDNQVQKDTVLTDVPIIHASGIKGALRDHFEQLWGEGDTKIQSIFGSTDSAGSYKFFTAMCIARPLRVSDGDRSYVLATSLDILKHFSAFLEGLGRGDFYSNERHSLEDGVKSIEVEGEWVTIKNCAALEPLIGKDFVVTDNLRDYDLPVRARNALDKNGQRRNLWYEEVVPHKSIFYFAVITPDNTCDLEFKKYCPVQFGGNASVGNGYCTIEEVFKHEQA